MRNKWYIAGLHFQCHACGSCCSGPEQGYIWIAKPEIKLAADYLKISVESFRQKYTKRFGLKTSIIEQSETKDCIFLKKTDGRKTCTIYSVRPNQCRTWPFWPSNLTGPDAWNAAAIKCAGINRGKYYSFDEIEIIKKQKKWYADDS